MKKIYVSDSFHTKAIAGLLQELYGSNAMVVCELNFEPVDDLMGSIIKAEADVVEHFENKTEIGNIDLFFLSARAILENQINIHDLKKTYGNSTAKVVVMSVMPEFLEDVQKGNYGADFFHDKRALLGIGVETKYLSDKEKALLQSYLN